MMVDEHLISLQPGTVIAGRYEVIKCLGSGNMGLVYACKHRELSGHIVAIKVLFPEVAQDKIAAARFRNEIFASYGVSHPNVVRAYEYLREGELQAYTMEYVGGGDLADRLGDRDTLMPIADIVRILAEISAGLQAIHDAGIVHRDMKPENVLLTKDGHVKIADFGIARTGTGPRLTEHGGVVGTIEYVSPEYMLNSQVDWRSDIYAMGIIAYEMITGEAAFQGESVYATMTKKLKEDPLPPSRKRPECPSRLDAIVLKAMARNPEARYQSAAEVFHDLQGIKEIPVKLSSTVLSNAPSVSSTYVGPSLLREKAPTAEKDEQPTSSSATGYTPAAGHYQDVSAARSRSVATDQWGFSSVGQSVESGREPAVARRKRIDTPSEEWIQPKKRVSGVKIQQTEAHRLERLSDPEAEETRSLMVDIITLVVAVLLGVGLGFVVLRSLFPDILGGSTEQGVVISYLS